MKVFVTGGSGFVGGAVIRRLRRAGIATMALARSEASAKRVEALGAQPVRGDLEDVTADHLRGADAVVHAAAFVGEWGTRAAYWAANVTGTERMLAAAEQAGVRRFVHVGTEAVLFDGHPLVDVDETRPYPTRHRYLYSETKAEAEKRVLAANKPGFETISIRPRFIWGPDDPTILPVVVEMAKAGRFMWLDGGRARTSTTHIENCALGLELALTRGVPGRAYFITDEGETRFRPLLTALAASRGVTLPDKSLPGWFIRPVAALLEAAWSIFGIRKTPPITRLAADMMCSDVVLKIDRAKAELGYAPIVDRDEGLRAMAAPPPDFGRQDSGGGAPGGRASDPKPGATSGGPGR